MSLKGKFEWIQSKRLGGARAISFVLTCDNLFQSEKFNCAMMASDGSVQPIMCRQLTLKAKQSLRFDFDTINWNWCNGDSFVILGKKDKIVKQWPLSLRVYGNGECPECHGMHRCHACNGRGYNEVRHDVEYCKICHGSGKCQTCYLPTRNPQDVHASTKNSLRHRSEVLRDAIAELQGKIQQVDWDIKMMQLHGQDVTMSGSFSNKQFERSQYRKMINNYEYELAQLQGKL